MQELNITSALERDEAWRQFVKSYVGVYKQLVEQFVERIGDITADGMPQPFFPSAGKNYPTTRRRIVFVGIETRGWGKLVNFLTSTRNGIEEAITEQLDLDLQLVEAEAKASKPFWSFVLRFLAAYHNVSDFTQILERPDILSSFAWANEHSVERFHVSAQKGGAQFKDWQTVKDASAVLDWGDNVVRALHPHLMVILNWGCDEDWLTELYSDGGLVPVDDHLLYYFLPGCRTHVIWTAHPRYLNPHFPTYAERSAQLAREKLG